VGTVKQILVSTEENGDEDSSDEDGGKAKMGDEPAS
tara:strand:+ start:1139 stop:1246 length:108 start_codon:yes stop_codon:yes gene_type:complete